MNPKQTTAAVAQMVKCHEKVPRGGATKLTWVRFPVVVTGGTEMIVTPSLKRDMQFVKKFHLETNSQAKYWHSGPSLVWKASISSNEVGYRDY